MYGSANEETTSFCGKNANGYHSCKLYWFFDLYVKHWWNFTAKFKRDSKWNSLGSDGQCWHNSYQCNLYFVFYFCKKQIARND